MPLHPILALIAALLWFSTPTLTAGNPGNVRPEHSGAWFDPAHTGEGFLLEILDQNAFPGIAVLYWFTYDSEGRQRWFTATGAIAGDSISFDNLLMPVGARFGDAFDPADVELRSVGSVRMVFESCLRGSVEYTVDGVAGTQSLERLTAIAGHDCQGVPRTSDVLLAGLSGSWFDSSRAGEGFVVEITATDQALIYWFTFDAAGHQAWHFGLGEIRAGQLVLADVLTPRGPQFGPAFDPDDLVLDRWGTLSFELGCSALIHRYEGNNGEAGDGQVQALTQVGNTRCTAGTRLAERMSNALNGQPDAANFEFGASWAAQSMITGDRWQGAAGQVEALGQALEPDTPFFAANMGTLVTAVTALSLVDSGVLDLDATIDSYLSPAAIRGLVVVDGVDHSADLTLRHLLGHRSGLPDPIEQAPRAGTALADQLLADPAQIRSAAALIDYARHSLVANARPGEDFLFSTVNNALVARLIESAVGANVAEAARERVLGPAGMTGSWLIGVEDAPAGSRLAGAYVGDLDINQVPSLYSFWAGAGWAMTVEDLGRLLTAIAGFDSAGQILSEASRALLFANDSSYLGAARFGLGGMTRRHDCAVRNATLHGFMGNGSFAWWVPERSALIYGFNSRLDYFGYGYMADALEGMFGAEACRDAGGLTLAEQPPISLATMRQLDGFLRNTDTAAMLAMVDGEVVYRYGQPGRRYNAHSIRKSFVSALYGEEVRNGVIDLNATVGDLGIDDVLGLSQQEQGARVRHLLQSRSGIYHPAAGSDGNGPLPPRNSAAPGTAFYYNNWDFNVAGRVFEQVTGLGVFDRFATAIAQPLGMEDFHREDQFYLFERDLSRHPAYLFTVSARDMARFGQLYLNQGRWQGLQLIPASWVVESTRSSSSTGNPERPGFGYMNWTVLDDGYMATGRGGHKILVSPADRLVVVLRVDTYNDGALVRDERFSQVVDLLRSGLDGG